MKNLILLPILFSIGYSQCDANGDGELNILDVIEEVNCILDDCWYGEPVCEGVGDTDGNCYETIQIGEQLWMAENLRVTHYNDGSEIPTGYSDSEWADLEDTGTGAYAVYPADDDNTSQETCGDNCADVYGNLYNGYAVDDDRGVCPEGWHVPTDEEFMVLEMYLGMSEEEANSTEWRGTDEGGKLKEAGLDHWNSPNPGATNESGFTGLPAGYRNASIGYYANMGNFAYFWSSSEFSSYYAWYRGLHFSNSGVSRLNSDKEDGFSIRCLGD